MSYLLDPTNYNLTDSSSIPNLTVQHLIIVGISMLLSLIVAIPIGIAVARYKKFYAPVITIAGILYTIPALALLCYLVPITGLSLTTIIIPLFLMHSSPLSVTPLPLSTALIPY